ncbi:MAG: 3'-5' exonuclease, partial [Phycisphaerae bacterium]
EGPDVGLRVRLAEVLEQLRRWRELGRRRPVAELLARIYQETGYLEYVGGMPEGVQRRANLLKLHERARQFGQFAHQGLFRFLRFIEQLQQRQYDMGSAPPLSEAQDVVRIMSIHRSKGLEFPVVIVAELGKRFNLRDVQGAMLVDRRAYLGLRAIDADRRISYPTLPYQLVRQEIISQRLAEELRVLYVALTRARERLILIGTASLGQVERWRQRWAGQESGLSELQLLAGRCALDWLVPALACQSDRQVIWSSRDRPEAGQRGVVSIHCHDPEAIGSWREPEGQVELGREGLEPFSRLEPVGQVGPADEVVARTISRLHSSYRHERLTDLPAVVSVSELKRRFVRLAEPDERVASYLLPAWTAERPRFLGGGRGEAGERGSATHLFLQHVELARPCDRRDLARQLERAVAEGLLSQEQRQMVDLEGLVWFFGTELGRRLRGAGRQVRRELPFVAGLSPDRYDSGLAGGRFDPADRILLRGMIDCVMVEDGRIEVIDYKTDRVGDDELGGRIELYRPQVQLYG